MLFTSGFVDDVMFLHNGRNGPESKTTRMFRPVRRCLVCVLSTFKISSVYLYNTYHRLCPYVEDNHFFFQQGGQNSILYNLQNRHYLHCTRFPKDVTDEPLNYWFRAYPFIRGLAENGLLNIATVYSYPHYFLLLADRNTKKCYLYVR